MNRNPITLELTWSEAANLLVAAQQVKTDGWTPAARGNLRNACEKLAAALPMNDPNALFLVVRGQTVVRVDPFHNNPSIQALERADKERGK